MHDKQRLADPIVVASLHRTDNEAFEEALVIVIVDLRIDELAQCSYPHWILSVLVRLNALVGALTQKPVVGINEVAVTVVDNKLFLGEVTVLDLVVNHRPLVVARDKFVESPYTQGRQHQHDHAITHNRAQQTLGLGTHRRPIHYGVHGK